MAKKGGSPPPSPDPFAVSAAQTGSNVSTALANSYLSNANEQSPYGNVNYTISGYNDVGGYQIPTWNRKVDLSPAQQGLLDQQTALQTSLNSGALTQVDRLKQTLNQPFAQNLPPRYDSIGPAPTNQRVHEYAGLATSLGEFGDPGANSIQRDLRQVGAKTQFDIDPNRYARDREAVEAAMFQRLNPQLQKDNDALDTRLVNSGLVRGSKAYEDQMDQYNRKSNDARLAITAAGLQEQQGLFAMDKAAGEFRNNAVNQDFQHALGEGSFRNSAQGQQFSQALSRGNFRNQAQQGEYSNMLGARQYNNSLNQQDFGNQQTIATFGNTARERALQEELALRNQPINEIATLMQGGQVTMPQFTQFRPGTVAPTDVSGNVYNSANINAQNWRAGVQADSAAAGALYGLGGSALTAGLGRMRS
jgi:hypothetical protein